MQNTSIPTDLHPKGTRLLKLLHLKTRSVCTSRQAEWRKGHRWTFREDADGTGALNGVECLMAVRMPKAADSGPGAIGEPMVGSLSSYLAETKRYEEEQDAVRPAKVPRRDADPMADLAGGSVDQQCGECAASSEATTVTNHPPESGTPPARTSTHDHALTKSTAFDERRYRQWREQRRPEDPGTLAAYPALEPMGDEVVTVVNHGKVVCKPVDDDDIPDSDRNCSEGSACHVSQPMDDESNVGNDAHSRRPRQPVGPDELARGDAIVLRNLTERCDFNGRRGWIMDYEAATGRCSTARTRMSAPLPRSRIDTHSPSVTRRYVIVIERFPVCISVRAVNLGHASGLDDDVGLPVGAGSAFEARADAHGDELWASDVPEAMPEETPVASCQQLVRRMLPDGLLDGAVRCTAHHAAYA